MCWGDRLSRDEGRRGRAGPVGDRCLGEIGQRVDALLATGGDDGEDALDVATAGAGLRAEGAVPLHDAAALGAFGGIIGRLHAFDAEERPERRFELAEIVADGLCFRVGVMAFAEQGGDGGAHRLEAAAHVGKGDQALAVLPPALKQPIDLGEQRRADALGGWVAPFADGEKVAVEMRPTELASVQRQPVVRAMPVGDHDGLVVCDRIGDAQQFAGHVLGATAADEVDGGCRGGHRPEPAALERVGRRLAGIGLAALRPAGLVQMLDRSLFDLRAQRRHRREQRRAHRLLDGDNRGGRDGQPEDLAQQRAHRPFGEVILAGEQRDERLDVRPQGEGGHAGRQRRARDLTAVRAGGVLQLILGNQWRDGRYVEDLMPPRRAGQGTVGREDMAAGAGGGRHDDGRRRQLLGRHQWTGHPAMSALSAGLPTGRPRPTRLFVLETILRRRKGRIAGGLPGLLPQALTLLPEGFKGAAH